MALDVRREFPLGNQTTHKKGTHALTAPHETIFRSDSLPKPPMYVNVNRHIHTRCLSLAHLGSAQLGSAELCAVQLTLAWLSSVLFGSSQPGLAQLWSTLLSWAHLCLAQLGLAWLGSIGFSYTSLYSYIFIYEYISYI